MCILMVIVNQTISLNSTGVPVKMKWIDFKNSFSESIILEDFELVF